MPASDAQLVGRALRGDQAAFGELAHRYRRAARGLAQRLTGDPETARAKRPCVRIRDEWERRVEELVALVSSR